MEIRTDCSPKDAKHYDTERLRKEFLVDTLFAEDEIRLVYTHIDRMIFGSAVPADKPLKLEADDALRTDYFLERRELGLINIGGAGRVTADGTVYELKPEDGLYLGMGIRDVVFESLDGKHPARFYLCSAPAHRPCPACRILKTDKPSQPFDVAIRPENRQELGTLKTSNHRTINKYILPGQVESCQLEMGLTRLVPGSVWNTMPCHTHERRMEVYLYFNLPKDGVVMHFTGEPDETRHLVVRNEQAVISPSWSIHAGCGSRSYSFIWAMAGENQDFDDMDAVRMQDLL